MVRRGTGNAATPSNPLHNHSPFSRLTGETRYPRWGAGRARLPPPTCHTTTPAHRPDPPCRDASRGHPPGRTSDAATPTNPLHNHSPFSRLTGETRYPRWGAGRARLPPPTCHTTTPAHRPDPPCRDASRGHPPGRTSDAATPTNPLHNHSPFSRLTGETRYPRWGAGRALLPPPTSHPATPPLPSCLPSSPRTRCGAGTHGAGYGRVCPSNLDSGQPRM